MRTFKTHSAVKGLKPTLNEVKKITLMSNIIPCQTQPWLLFSHLIFMEVVIMRLIVWLTFTYHKNGSELETMR